MKQAKRKKSAAAPVQSADAGIASGEQLLPDAEYVAQLLGESATQATDGAVAVQAAETAVATADASVSQGPLSLPAQCLLRDAVEYRQQLLNCLQARTVMLDVAAVERIDAAFLQVLLAFVRSRPRDSEPVTWLNVNSVFVDAARLLGVQTALALPAAA